MRLLNTVHPAQRATGRGNLSQSRPVTWHLSSGAAFLTDGSMQVEHTA